MRSGMNQKRAGLAWLMGLVGVAVALSMAFSIGRGGTAMAQDDEAALEGPTGDIGVAAIDELPEGAVVYTVVGEESEASYSVEEELAGQGDVTAVGTTNAIVGEIVVDGEGNPVAGSRIDIDLRTLTTDETRRDNYLRTNSLESDTYPLATFILTGVENWSGSLADGEEVTFDMVGHLTVHGVTREVTWESTATLDDGVLTGTATVEVEMGDFDIEKPSVGFVLSLDETVRLDLAITANVVE
jgi:polyisoprenoid-binding protein YceI